MKSSPMPSTIQEPASIIFPVVDQRREDRADRIGQHHLGLGRDLARRSGRGRSACRRSRRRTTTASTSCSICSQISGPVVVSCASGLAGLANWLMKMRARRLGGDALGHVLVVVRMALADVGARDAHVDAQRAQVLDLLARHLVGHDQDQLVALEDADLREAEAGVAGGGLDDRAAGLRACRRFSAASIIERPMRSLIEPPGFCALQLDEQPAGAGVEAASARAAACCRSGRGRSGRVWRSWTLPGSWETCVICAVRLAQARAKVRGSWRKTETAKAGRGFRISCRQTTALRTVPVTSP